MSASEQLDPRDAQTDAGRVSIAGQGKLDPRGIVGDAGRVIHVDGAIARIASRQKALITTEQLLAVGLSGGAVEHRVRTERLHRVHRGVFSLSPSLMPLARELAAVMACGRGAMASHRSAAFIYGLLPAGPDIHVTVKSRSGRSREGVAIHRPRTAPERTIYRGVPVTTITQTILDLAATEPAHDLDRALNEARVKGLASDHTLTSLTEQSANKPGAAALRAALHHQERGFTRSRAERKLRQLVEDAGVPRPLFNTRKAGASCGSRGASSRRSRRGPPPA